MIGCDRAAKETYKFDCDTAVTVTFAMGNMGSEGQFLTVGLFGIHGSA